MIHKSMSLEYEPASESLHIQLQHRVLTREGCTQNSDPVDLHPEILQVNPDPVVVGIQPRARSHLGIQPRVG